MSLLNCRPPAAEFQAEPWRDAEPSPPSTLDIADWPDLPPLQAISTPVCYMPSLAAAMPALCNLAFPIFWPP